MSAKTSENSRSNGNREQEISTISRSIKEIAKELDVPIIALAQLSRSVEQRGGDKRPILSDLRESGAIEQDADIVSFIYRPDYYGFMTDETTGADNTGVGEIIIRKHRNGAQGTVRLKFIDQYARFDNLDEMPDYNQMTQEASDKTSAINNPNNTFTVPSKMNKTEDSDDFGDFGKNEDTHENDF